MENVRYIRETPSDIELVRRVNDGDISAFTMLSERYRPMLVKHAWQYSGIIGVDAEDFIQEGMFALFRAVKGYKTGSAIFRTYATSCIYNSMTDVVRTQMKISRANSHISIDDIDDTVFSECTVLDTLIERESNRARSRQIETVLSKFEQKVLKLYLSGYSYQQISGTLSTATKSVDNALQRVRRKLRQTVAAKGF